MDVMPQQLIFDIGCHRGEDSHFYLAKGFRVVAVEAHPDLCSELRSTFSNEIASGQFTLVESAIADREGSIPFYVSPVSIWGSIHSSWAERGDKVEPIEVPAITFESLINQFGMPYYLKIDIEGADLLCLEGLLAFSERPRFVSFESERRAISDLSKEIALLRRLGCRRFQIVNQERISEQREPSPPREGRYAGYAIHPGSTGLFGRELSWVSLPGFLAKYVSIYASEKIDRARHKLGQSGVSGSWPWYDIHAAW